MRNLIKIKVLFALVFIAIPVTLSTGCTSMNTPAPEVFIEPNAKVLYLDDLEMQGKVHFIELKMGDYVLLGSNKEHDDYHIEWNVTSSMPNVIYVNPPVYDEENNLTSFFSLTALVEGKSTITIKGSDNNDVAYIEFTVSR